MTQHIGIYNCEIFHFTLLFFTIEPFFNKKKKKLEPSFLAFRITIQLMLKLQVFLLFSFNFRVLFSTMSHY